MHVCTRITMGTCRSGASWFHCGLLRGFQQKEQIQEVQQPLLCPIHALHTVFNTIPKIDFFHFVLVVMKKKSGGSYYSIYEKESDVLHADQ